MLMPDEAPWKRPGVLRWRGVRRHAAWVLCLTALWRLITSPYLCSSWLSLRTPLQAGLRRGARSSCRAGEAAEARSEATEIWQQAYAVEAERAQLLEEQLKLDLSRVGPGMESLRAEFEGCLVDLSAPPSPATEAEDEWATAYTSIRRCNEQLQLKISELRGKLEEKEAIAVTKMEPVVTMDMGPIRFKGTKFKGIQIPRLATAKGSLMFFVELEMPLGLRLEEIKSIEGESSLSSIQVMDIAEGGSAFADGRIREGDILRALTVPRRRLRDENSDEQVQQSVDRSINWKVGFGELAKAMLVIPSKTEAFNFERTMGELSDNAAVDGYVGLVFERPYT